ncbi:hypothetical protein NE237_027851 [Protea cynaroides]|uniref:Uncharacterized protein n=1 Tax=Protea cynaroides TaxID=273540 RepID=A0A9Q0JSB7_9MAGN|nr:hypothetical protein NE237_027851 [Protea cynaroides]
MALLFLPPRQPDGKQKKIGRHVSVQCSFPPFPGMNSGSIQTVLDFRLQKTSLLISEDDSSKVRLFRLWSSPPRLVVASVCHPRETDRTWLETWRNDCSGVAL